LSEAQHGRAGAGQLKSTGRVSVLQVGAFVACSWLLAGATIWAVQLPHQGLEEHIELPPLAHWLRDTAVAVPLAALSVGVAALVVRWGAVRAGRPRAGSLVPWLAWAGLAAALFALLSIPGNQLHGLLFGAEEEEIGWLEDALLDGGIVLGASLLVLVSAALIGRQIWPAARAGQESNQAPVPTHIAAAGLTPSLATAGSTHVGGDR